MFHSASGPVTGQGQVLGENELIIGLTLTLDCTKITGRRVFLAYIVSVISSVPHPVPYGNLTDDP